MTIKPKVWERVNEDVSEWTDRMKVPGGWLYRVIITWVDEDRIDRDPGVAMVFVPDARQTR